MTAMFILKTGKTYVGHDFREIWWLLKEPFVCVGRLSGLRACLHGRRVPRLTGLPA